MMIFVEGDLSREMHRKITADHNNKVEHMSEIQEALFDLLDSYSDEQKDQVEANLEEKWSALMDEKQHEKVEGIAKIFREKTF